MGGGGLALGGGGIGIVVLVIYLLVSAFSGRRRARRPHLTRQPAVGEDATPSQVSEECKTGQDANQREDCRIVAVVNSVQKFWDETFDASNRAVPVRRHGLLHRPGQHRLRQRHLAGRPLLLPGRQARLHRPRLLRRAADQFGAKDTPFVEAYVIAHEYGHHVQDLLGVLDRIGNDTQGPESRAVRSELQADCYAGVWAANAVETRVHRRADPAGHQQRPRRRAAIGDDRIQEKTQGQVNPETFTHGTSEQRRRWFSRGYETGKPAACDTFTGSI